MAEPQTASAMARETAEIPAVAERLLARTDLFAAIAERIEQAKPRIVVFCGRGSSGHVGVYLRYLFEARLGLLGSAAAPSVVTAYQRPAGHARCLVRRGVAVRAQSRYRQSHRGGAHVRRADAGHRQ